MRDPKGAKVMVVDNDRAVLELVQIRLDLAGFHAFPARSGEGALDLLKHLQPDAMVLELGLPDIDGFRLLEISRTRADFRPYPVLVMKRSLSSQDVQRAARLGVGGCLTKPFSGADVVDRVGRLFRMPNPADRIVVLSA
jgi:DNA-binding response OmpR family regulator